MVAVCLAVLSIASLAGQIRDGDAAFNAGQMAEAEAAYTRALAINPDDAVALLGRGRTRLNLRRPEDALADLNRAVALAPITPGVFQARALVYVGLKDFRAAIADCTRAVELAPDDQIAWASRGWSYVQLRNYRAAIDDYTQALQLKPDDLVARNNRGYAYQQLDNRDSALRDFERVLELRPKDIYALTHRAEILESLGDRDGAKKAYEAVLAVDPKHPSATLHVAALGGRPAATGVSTQVLPQVAGAPTRPAGQGAGGATAHAATTASGRPTGWPMTPTLPVDLKGLTKANAMGLGATLAAGMEVLTGAAPGSNRKMNALGDFVPAGAQAPGAELADAMGRTVHLKGVAGSALANVQRAGLEARMAAHYGNDAATKEALDIAYAHLETAVAAQTGIVKLADEAKQIPPLPDAADEKAKANEAYRRMLARTKATVLDDGQPGAGAQPGFKLVSAEVPPAWAMTATERERNTYSGAGTSASVASTWKDQFSSGSRFLEWSVPSRVLPGVPAKFAISGRTTNSGQKAGIHIGYQWTDFGDRHAHRPVHLCGVRQNTGWQDPNRLEPDVVADSFDLVIPDVSQYISAYLGNRARPKITLQVRDQNEMDAIVLVHEDSRSTTKTPSELPLQSFEYDYLTWTAQGPDQKPVPSLRIVVASNLVYAVYTYRWVDDVGAEGTDEAIPADPPLPDLPPDKAEEFRFHRANIAIIQRTLAKDEADLAATTDDKGRAILEWRILQDKSELVAEQDLIASIEQGEIVHSRSPFDDYAHDRFVESIKKENSDAFEKKRAAIQRLLAMVPEDRREGLRAFVERQLTPQVLGTLDHQKLRDVANALSDQVQGYWQGESAKATDEAIKYDDWIKRAERAKFVADTTVMVGSMGGGALYTKAAGYAVTSALVTDGPVEAINQAALYYAAPVHAAIEAMKEYPKGGAWGAAAAGTVGFLMSKLTQLGAGEGEAGALAGKEAASLAEFEHAQAIGEDLVREYKKTREALVAARDAGRSIPEVRALEQQLIDRAAAVQTNTHAKGFLKYGSDGALQKAFVEQIDGIHARINSRFDEIMAARNWNPQELKPIRNASSAGSVNMDFDIGLVEFDTVLNRKKVLEFLQDGQKRSMAQWQKDAQTAWEQAFRDLTGREAGEAMEQVTTSIHAEAYRDLAWIGRDMTATGEMWARQAGDVTRFKAQHLLGTSDVGAVDYCTRLMEAARGTAKDLNTKLLPRLELMKNRIPGPGGPARQQELLKRWKDIQGLLADIGEGRIDPVHGDRMVRAMTGGYSIPEVIDHGSTLLGEFSKLAAKPVRR
ncbi:MAG: tetratricopeptide repeat protein [Acidobacteriota bacterium]